LDISRAIARAEAMPEPRPNLHQAMAAAGMVAPPPADAPEIGRVAVSVPVTDAVQRVITEDAPAPAPKPSSETEAESAAPPLDLDKLADDVYRALRGKLRADAQRRPKDR
jgi:hypothetical protein